MISLTGTRGLFTRLGTMGGVVYDTQVFAGTTLPGDLTTLLAQFDGGYQDEALIDGINSSLLSGQNGAAGLSSAMPALAQAVLNWMVFLDNPLFSNSDVQLSLTELITQMTAAGASVQKVTTATSVSTGSSNVGDGVLVATTYQPNGLLQENAFAEHVQVICTSDAITGGTTAGQETFTASGEVAQSNVLAPDWPLGSGAQTSVTCIDATVDAQGGQILSNGDFEGTWTSNTPADWTITVGTAGTQILKSTGQHYTGANSCNFVGDGSTLTAIEQEVSLSGETLYACNLFVKVDSTPAAGVLEVALVNGSGTIINDQAGNANSFTKALTAVSTTWIPVNGVFRTPYQLPATTYLRIRLSTALTNARNLYVDHVGFGRMTQLYAFGPALALFSGSTDFLATTGSPDNFVAAVTSTRPGSLKTFQTLAFRLWNTSSAYGLQLPSSASPTISDSLI